MYFLDAIRENEIKEGPIECQVTGLEILNRKAKEGLLTRVTSENKQKMTEQPC